MSKLSLTCHYYTHCSVDSPKVRTFAHLSSDFGGKFLEMESLVGMHVLRLWDDVAKFLSRQLVPVRVLPKGKQML